MPLTTEDRELIARLRDSGRLHKLNAMAATGHATKIERIDYFRQENFTIAVVKVARGAKKVTLVGVAKRNCNDDDENPRRGADIALTRALRGDAKPIIDPTASLAT